MRTVAILAGLLLAFLVQEFTTLLALTLGPSPYVIAVKRTSVLLTAVVGYAFLREREQSLEKLLLASGLVVAGVVPSHWGSHDSRTVTFGGAFFERPGPFQRKGWGVEKGQKKHASRFAHGSHRLAIRLLEESLHERCLAVS